ncbi:Mur ligase [Pseudoluteimonas lycopersici]|uniref:Mur ligase n=1 Tax=Pseudoluteimonas lycopersici TaxID=1324796 RepID=A0A516V797_9GAMM|nr:Mur ligase family protein [Lysobacter lycopersici]QDQ74395.1 Mur ligase [Lysobacter lycopersici]
MGEPFEDSRRLTGANLYFDGPGAALETAPGLSFDANTLRCWRDNIARVRVALDWPDGAVVVREHATGASLAFAAPIDRLYAATEANEWALYAALGLRADDTPVDEESDSPRPHVAHFDDVEALRQLQGLAQAEAKPDLVALIEAARVHDVPAHADDDALSIGEGATSQSWPMSGLPSVDAVPWSRLHAVPKAVVTGSNGKTTTVRLLAAMLKAHGLRAGYSSTDGLFIDGECVDAGDYSGPVGARTVLRDARVQAAVLETARGGLLRRGLVADDARVAVVTNVSADHFGEYGIHTLDDLAKVKLVVAKSLAPDGLLVLNADDAMLVEHASSTGVSRIGWFAFDLADALAHSAIACGVRDGRLILSIDGADHDLGDVAAMPLTVGGSARYNIANIAAASLAAFALDIDPKIIAKVLVRFGASNADNPGRLQRWALGDVQVLLDYAHNPDGLRGLLAVAAGLRGDGRMALLLGHAGNRLDEDFRALAAVAAEAKPDRVWLKDIAGDYLRGRESGEVAGLLRDALLATGMAGDALPVRLDEAQAVREALAWARPGDLLVLPVHEPAARDAVVALLDRLRDAGWNAGQALADA